VCFQANPELKMKRLSLLAISVRNLKNAVLIQFSQRENCHCPPLELAYAHIFFKDVLAFDSAALHTLQKPQPFRPLKGKPRQNSLPTGQAGQTPALATKLVFGIGLPL